MAIDLLAGRDIPAVNNSQSKDLLAEMPNSDAQEGFFHKLPKNIRAGLAGLQRNAAETGLLGVKRLEDLGKVTQLAMMPFNGDQLLATQNKPYSESGQELLNKIIPENYNQTLGPQNPTMMDKLIQGGITHAPELMAGSVMVRGALPYLSRRVASRPYRQARAALEEAGANNLNIPEGLINDAESFLPNTQANRRLINRARTGDFRALFDLQSDLGRASARLSRNPFSAAERETGRAGLQTREAILEAKQNELQNMGLEDIANLLEQGRAQYRGYHAVNPYKKALLGLGATYAAQQTGIPPYLKKLLFPQ